MKAQLSLFTAAALGLGLTFFAAGQQPEPAAPNRIVVNVDAQQTAQPVSKYEFGMFIEHIGPLIYRSLWSEMLDDRKFYFPITAKAPAPPAGEQAAQARRNALRRWTPVGSDDVVVMDKEQPFVGDQSPRIALDASEPHGIQQTGIALIKGKKYVGRIYLRGTSGAHIKVSLIWGAGANDRQTLTFASLTDSYKKLPLNFTAGA